MAILRRCLWPAGKSLFTKWEENVHSFVCLKDETRFKRG